MIRSSTLCYLAAAPWSMLCVVMPGSTATLLIAIFLAAGLICRAIEARP